MDNKQRLVLLVTGLFLVLLCGGLSYAFFSSISNNESSSTIFAKGGSMTIKYANGSGTIKRENIYPREEAWVNKVFTVTGNNTTDLEMNYRLYLVVSSNGFNFGDLTYSISGTSTNLADTLISKANQLVPGVGQMSMGAGIFKSKTSTHSYNLRIFYKETGENQNSGQGKGFAGYLKIDSGSILAYDALIENKTTNSSKLAFNGPITREEVEKVTFNNTNVVPSNVITSWDASDKQNGSVMAYTLDEDNDGLYEVYIGQNGGVIANSNSWYLFSNFSKLETLNLNNLNTSKVTNMSYMFSSSAVTSLDLSSFDTSNVTSMSNMFSNSKATTLDLSSFDTSKVTNMQYMFINSAATSIDLSSFNTSRVTNMSQMFSNSKATSLDLSNFNTTNVTNMAYMFQGCTTAVLNLSNFDTSNVTAMHGMFASSAATEIKGLDKFVTANVTNMYRMFYGSAATSLDLSNFDTSNVTNMSSMFGESKATTLDLSSFDTSNVTSMSSMFRNASATTGYARTKTDANRFNASSNKPSGLTFVVKS